MPRLNHASALALAPWLAAPLLVAVTASAQTEDAPVAGAELVRVDWVEEMMQGGMTMVALTILSVAMVAFAVERALAVRRDRFCPQGLVDEVLPLARGRRYGEAAAACAARPSVLSDVVVHILTHRKNDVRVISEGAADLAGREVADQQEKAYPLAVIAALAPLLGLLGTMIGMIEAFKLVEVFGDEGGASMLAGSISKALITTAVGLILAIPSLVLFHLFRRRIHAHSIALEREVDRLLNGLFLRESSLTDAPSAEPQPSPARTRSRPARPEPPQTPPRAAPASPAATGGEG